MWQLFTDDWKNIDNAPKQIVKELQVNSTMVKTRAVYQLRDNWPARFKTQKLIAQNHILTQTGCLTDNSNPWCQHNGNGYHSCCWGRRPTAWVTCRCCRQLALDSDTTWNLQTSTQCIVYQSESHFSQVIPIICIQLTQITRLQCSTIITWVGNYTHNN